ncbi:MAG: hypothetical protein B7Z68_07345, partial [Acidobacteria bacterium 21-70-11]
MRSPDPCKGDLKQRVALVRDDEIGDLAASFDRMMERLAAIYEISEAAQQAANLDDLFADVHRIVGRLLDARNFFIALYDAAEDLVTLPYFVDEEDETPPPQGPRRGLTGYVIRTGQPLLATPEVFEDLCRRGEVETIGAPSIDWLGVPLIVGSETIGALVVQTYREGVRYGEREKDILVFVSRQVAQAIARKRAEEAIRQSEEKFRHLFDNSEVGMFTTRLDGSEVLEFNKKYLTILGYTHEEVRGIPSRSMWADKSERDKMVELLKAQGYVANRECGLLNKQGEVRRCITSMRLDRDTGILEGSIQDITERRRAEEALRESKSQLQTLLESSFEGILAVDNKGNVIEANRQFAEMWYILPSLIESGNDQALLEFVLGQLVDPDAFLDKVHALYHSTAMSTDTLLFKDGRTFERHSSPLMREGAVAGRVWSFLDITERRRAEETLRQSEERYRTILQTIAEGYFEVDLKGTMTFCNDSLTAMLGYSREELIGLNNRAYMDEATAAKVFATFNRVYRTGEPTEAFDWELIRKDGTRIIVETSVSLLRDRD